MALTPAQKLAAAVAAVSDPHNGSSPYFGPVLRGLVRREVERDSSLRTLAVSAQGVLYWQPAFIEKHSIEDLRWALEHETMHVILKHADRRDAIGADPKLFNWAADACINDDLREGGRPIASWAIFPETLGQPKGLTAEERYRRLRDDAQAQQQAASQIGSGQGNNDACDNPQSGGGGGGGGGQDDSGDGGPQQGDGQDGATDETGQEGGGVGAGNCGSCAGRKGSWEDAERDNKEGRTEAEIEGMRRETAEAIREHGKREGGTGRGTIPGNLARWADDFLKPPKVDWRQHLQQAVREGVAYKRGMVDTYYGGVSRRQAGIGFGPGRPILPVFRAPIPRVACIVDTSGSMGSDELMDAVSETSGVLQAVGSDVSFIACDARVQGVTTIADPQQIPALLKGGGGTRMEPAFAACAELKDRPDVVICFTDGGIDTFPEPEWCRVIWVVVGGADGQPNDWGETIVVDSDDDQDAAA